jgi:hypothetical protein
MSYSGKTLELKVYVTLKVPAFWRYEYAEGQVVEAIKEAADWLDAEITDLEAK